MTSPLSLTVPARLTISHPGHHITVPIQVADSGTRALQIHVTDGAYTKLAQQHNATSWITGMTPQSFTVRPGHSQVVQVTLAIPAGAGGEHATQVVFTASAPGDPTGNVSISGAVASTIQVDLPGKDTTTAHAPPLVTGPPPGTFPAVPVAAGGTGLLVALLAVVVVSRARRGRGTHHRTSRHAA